MRKDKRKVDANGRYEGKYYRVRGLKQDFECLYGKLLLYGNRTFKITRFTLYYTEIIDEDRKNYEVKVDDDKIPFLFTYNECESFLDTIKLFTDKQLRHAQKDIERVERKLKEVKGRKIIYGVRQLIINGWYYRHGIYTIIANDGKVKMIKTLRNAVYFAKTLTLFNEKEFLQSVKQYYKIKPGLEEIKERHMTYLEQVRKKNNNSQ